jgi:D-alanyl-lipoteichoic acid acyltransferase DltB (MBOAT superfamily)
MLLGGLWHGAGWHFVAWGAMHGVGLGAERWFRGLFRWPAGLGFVAWIVSQAWVTMAWVFFRSPSVDFALDFLWHMFKPHKGFVISSEIQPILIFAVVPVVHHLAPFAIRLSPHRALPWVLGGCVGVALTLGMVIASPSKAFIYFRF